MKRNITAVEKSLRIPIMIKDTLYPEFISQEDPEMPEETPGEEVPEEETGEETSEEGVVEETPEEEASEEESV